MVKCLVSVDDPALQLKSLRKRSVDDNDDGTLADVSFLQKKQKIDRTEFDKEEEKMSQEVGANELATALALTSLALNPRRCTVYEESRDADQEDDQVSTQFERSPREDRVPLTPDSYSYASSNGMSSNNNKKVTFSNDTKRTERQTPRRSLFSPQSPQASQLPIVEFRRRGTQRPRLPPSMPLLAPLHSNTLWNVPSHHSRHTSFSPRAPAPLSTSSSCSSQSSKPWICDYCNVAAFSTYEEACIHEASCLAQCKPVSQRGCRLPPVTPPPSLWHRPVIHSPVMTVPSNTVSPSQSSAVSLPPFPFHSGTTASYDAIISQKANNDDVTSHVLLATTTSSQIWFQCIISLSIPSTDHEWLSELDCYIRTRCVEAFTAKESKFIGLTSSHQRGGVIQLNQVGIRCRFCAHCRPEERTAAAVSFPSSVSEIYESVQRWYRLHWRTCKCVPVEVRAVMARLTLTATHPATTTTTNTMEVSPVARRQYWVDAARFLGMVDTVDGIRFARDPYRLLLGREVLPSPSSPLSCPADSSNNIQNNNRGFEQRDEANALHLQNEKGISGIVADGTGLVFSSDCDGVPPYVHFLMSQVETCRFTEIDRYVARSKAPVGYRGFQCRHCGGHARLGKYFPITVKSLSTNSISQNIHAHLLKCNDVAPEIKRTLVELKDEKSKSPRLEPGWRKIFFDKIWIRLHGGLGAGAGSI